MLREPSSLTVKYGYRTLMILTILLVFSTFLIVEYLLTGESNQMLLMLFIIFLPLTLILFAGFRLTVVSRIEKKYYSTETLVGQKGKVLRGAKAGEKGSLTVSNEDWSFVSDSDTVDGEVVRVAGIRDDGLTLKVMKAP